MYLKQGNTYVVNDIANLSMKQLEVGDKIVLLTDDSPEVSTLAEISKNKLLYLFEGVRVNVNKHEEEEYEYEDDEEPTHISKTAYTDIDEIKELNLLLNDELYLLQKGRRVDMPSITNILDEVQPEYESFMRIIHKSIFGQFGDQEHYINKFSIDDMHFCFFNWKIDNNNSLVFAARNILQPKKRSWQMDKYCYLMTKEGDFYYLNHDFNILFSHIKQLVKEKFTFSSVTDRLNELEEVLSVMKNSTPTDYDNIQKRSWETYRIFEKHFSYNEIVELYSPIYENYALNFKVYPDTFDRIARGAKFVYEDRSIFHRNFKILDSGFENLDAENKAKIQKEMRVGQVVFNAFNKGYRYFDPDKGEQIDDGKVVENWYEYKDYGGIINNKNKSWNDPQYYIRINGYYVPYEKDFDGEEVIEELIQRKKLVDKLDEAL